MKSSLSKNIKSKKHKKQSYLKKRTMRLLPGINKNKKVKQNGGASINMTIIYGKDTDGIQLSSRQMNIDFTENYNQNKLAKEPTIRFNGLEQGKSYLLTMTDPDALGKTWTHWVAIINSDNNGNGKILKPEIASYAPPSPPDKSGIHHYIFRLYDTSTLTEIPSPLKKMSRGDYFAIKLKNIIEDKPVIAEATFTIDSSNIKKSKGNLIYGINLGLQIGLDALRTFAA
jgi:phosphatidylethanolamine-binding protein (PEBP) family uncharacterized protein